MRVLITGGAGFIGYHLACYHARLGHTVIVLDNLWKADGRPDQEFERLLSQPNVQFIPHDLTTPWQAPKEVDELDAVYHLAAINGTQLFYDIPYQVARTNLLVTINLLDALEGRRIGRVIYSSTSEVYAGAERYHLLKIPTDEAVPVVFPQPTPVRFSYGTSKFMGEVLCVHFGAKAEVPCAIIRYHNIYGPRMGTRHVIPEFIARVRQQENPFAVYGAHETRAFCYIDDAVEATYRVATTSACHGQIVHIGNATEETRIADLARLLMNLMGYQAELRERGSRNGSVLRRCPDTAKLKTLTGFQPTIDLREGLSRTVDWYLAGPESR
ncbi:MAG: NAD-dependent epimerase/dehydratase family protein [Candidatus Omnitrophica bacterium]|nr:NAD-dependent epimerase/dehydratase family protein [Candidatus Omnitrophota bacterium]